ncbi:MAG: type II toxin-antitoxin system Phd/YefM family antitoxin [Nocardioidaceae bacterium]
METRPLAEVRQDLSKFVDEAVTTHARFDITRNGKRAAVLLAADDFDTLLETLDVLSDEALVRQVHESLREADQATPAAEAYAEFKARRSHGAT